MGERNSYSKTDPDATFMRMKEDHMQNGQLKPGYNVQIAVHSEYIMGVGIFPNPNDTNTLIPFLHHLESLHTSKFRYIVADAGYDSYENLLWLEEKDTYLVLNLRTTNALNNASGKQILVKLVIWNTYPMKMLLFVLKVESCTILTVVRVKVKLDLLGKVRYTYVNLVIAVDTNLNANDMQRKAQRILLSKFALLQDMNRYCNITRNES